MQKAVTNPNATFGSMPVFMTAISTILGAILFLRFGWAVGHVGFLGVLTIIIIGHLVTIPTALAVAEIATNQKVQGGGAYYIISRSFGLNIGGAIGIALYLSQAISVAFYIIAFGEAFDAVLPYLPFEIDAATFKKAVTLIMMTLLSIIVVIRGANIGMKALYVVVGILFLSIILFFMGTSTSQNPTFLFRETTQNPESFFYVFTIIFPAFTGIAAGLGLSGDLRDPKKSIPKGTLWATLIGMVVYVAIAYKLTISATPDDLAGDQLIMQRIAIWGPIIPIGLAAATLSSAIGSILVAPRTLQAIGFDNILPYPNLNKWLSKGKVKDNDPVNGTLVTIAIAYFFVVIGDVNFVAQIISMFFMVTYGAICLISFLEHFAADPSYRPTFKLNNWYYSLAGALLSFWLMFKMNLTYAIISILIMVVIYLIISKYRPERRGLEKLFKGVVFQLSRQIQIFVQRANKEEQEYNWRPFAVCVSADSFERQSAFDLLGWISHKYGFGTYIHYVEGFLNSTTYHQSKKTLDRLIGRAKGSNTRVYIDTVISPSYTSAIAQVIQLSGISGKGSNLILFEFPSDKPESLKNALENYILFDSCKMDVCFLNTSLKGFGYKKEIHVWIGRHDFHNANLMVLLAYIILGHPDWKKGFIKIYSLVPAQETEEEKKKWLDRIKSGRLPIAPGNVTMVPFKEGDHKESIVKQQSHDADLTILGFSSEDINKGIDRFTKYDNMGNILFVNAYRKKEIE
ncbi:amino acid permease [Plebeiibacterium sediminum]|uniref:Amino acid permease n=1 Tax=Plebeiibacterium sediminum TaxID=2992112 RepID=A0AAE3SHB8_9BACT|nr:amino acid permease [Plebeiobacterium sediminum]MCW3788073.1 amino acid permease [Plebeiobacterium sediminum]